jgi:predicted Zn-dependent protease
MKETVPGLLTKALTPVKSLQDYFARESFMKNADVLAEIVTSPDGITRLRELRKLSPSQPKFWSGLAQVLASTGSFAASEALE